MARTLDQAKRTAILDAARKVFKKDGFAAAKMTDIASAAGVASGTLYLYFENKEALAGAIGEVFFAKVIAQLNKLVAQIEGPHSIEGLVDWALKTATSEKVNLAISREKKHETRGVKSAHRRELVDGLSAALAALMQKGVIRRYDDAVILAHLIIAILRRLLLSQAMYEDEAKSIQALKAGAVALLQHALFDDVTIAASRMVAARKQKGHSAS